MDKPHNDELEEDQTPILPLEEQQAYLPVSPLEEAADDNTSGLPPLNPKDWKKFIGCGG